MSQYRVRVVGRLVARHPASDFAEWSRRIEGLACALTTVPSGIQASRNAFASHMGAYVRHNGLCVSRMRRKRGVDEHAGAMRLAESPEMSAEGKASAARILPPACSTAGGAKRRGGGVVLLLQRSRGIGTKFARCNNATEVQMHSRSRSDPVR